MMFEWRQRSDANQSRGYNFRRKLHVGQQSCPTIAPSWIAALVKTTSILSLFLTKIMEEEDLDVSWINNEKRMLSVDHNYQREPLETILFHFCYTNSDTIHKVLTEKYIFRDNNSTVPLSDLEKIIEEKSKMDVTKYDFAEYVTFVVDLEPENIQSYVSEGMQVNFMSEKKTTLADIVCPQSIFIFHSLNAIIVVFKERVVPSITVPKSIMKKNSNITKKMVRFHNSKTKRTI
jgi:hypothetical protein